MKKNLTTEAGQTNSPNDRVDALNQIFALFKRNYHNQFFKAFAQQADVIAVKRLWMDALAQYDAPILLDAAMSVVKSSEFLPTLKTMLDHCERLSSQGLPDVHAAYTEACCAASPKIEQPWSHPAVYLTGSEIGWHFLQSNTEHAAFPVFKARYQQYCARVRAGESLELPIVKRLEDSIAEPASPAETQRYLKSLKSLLEDE